MVSCPLLFRLRQANDGVGRMRCRTFAPGRYYLILPLAITTKNLTKHNFLMRVLYEG